MKFCQATLCNATLRCVHSGVYSCDWSAQHRIIVSGGADKTVCLFNPFSGTAFAPLISTCMCQAAVLNLGAQAVVSLPQQVFYSLIGR